MLNCNIDTFMMCCFFSEGFFLKIVELECVQSTDHVMRSLAKEELAQIYTVRQIEA